MSKSSEALKEDLYTESELIERREFLGKLWAMAFLEHSEEEIAEALEIDVKTVRYEIDKIKRTLAGYEYPSVAAHSILQYTRFVSIRFPDEVLEQMERLYGSLMDEKR